MSDERTVGLEITSPLDGTRQYARLRLPMRATGPLPLVIAPHPFGWTTDEDYQGGCRGLKADRHEGWFNVASDLGIAVLQPEGHHRAVQWCSMGFEGVVRDLPAWIEAAATVTAVDQDRIYACGLSMGGLEALLMAGHFPSTFAAVFVFNPVVDVAAWQQDLARTTSLELAAEGGARVIVEEIGGTPAAQPASYARRSGFDVLAGLASVPTTIWWSHLDLIVPRQIERHGKRLYDELKRRTPTAPVSEYNHTSRHGLGALASDDERWAIHETSDYRFAARWLLLHERRRPFRPV